MPMSVHNLGPHYPSTFRQKPPHHYKYASKCNCRFTAVAGRGQETKTKLPWQMRVSRGANLNSDFDFQLDVGLIYEMA